MCMFLFLHARVLKINSCVYVMLYGAMCTIDLYVYMCVYIFTYINMCTYT